MFQRLKGFNLDFLDNKIAEEQAKQAQQSSSSPSGRRTPSSTGARRSSARPRSPNKRSGSRLRATDGDNGTPVKGPDPDDFVIGDDASDISRAATPLPTPQPVKEGSEGPLLEGKESGSDMEAKAVAEDASTPKDKGKQKENAVEDELSEDVRKKLARLDSLTARYQDLLRNYRAAHARVTSIEPFEATLREHTPLTSIADPGALVEFLNQRSLQSDMVMDELKRVSTENREVVKERDELKVKLDDAEKRAKEAFDEAAGLRKDSGGSKEVVDKAQAAEGKDESKDVSKEDGAEDETFFSYETELPRLEAEVEQYKIELQEQTGYAEQYKAELQEEKKYVNEILEENATMRQAEEVAKNEHETLKLNLDAMENKILGKDREIAKLSIELKDTSTRLADADNDRQDAREIEGAAEEELKRHQQEHEENLKNGTYVRREEKINGIQQNVVNAFKDQTKQAEEAKMIAEGRVADLQLELKRMESEADAAGESITRLRGHQDAAESWKKKAADAERERDEAKRIADSKKGHEAAVASLRTQLKRAEKDRDSAYQMIIDCGKCAISENGEENPQETPSERSVSASRSRGDSETTEQTEASTQSPQVSTPSLSVDGAPLAPEVKSKGKNKNKKSKAKKKDAGKSANASTAPSPPLPSTPSQPPSIEELIKNPEKANEILSRPRDDKLYFEIIKKSMESLKEDRNKEDADHEELLRHHEAIIEEREGTIKTNEWQINDLQNQITMLNARIRDKEDAIQRLDRKLMGEANLREEIETLKESIIETGSESTDAKYELKELKGRHVQLQVEHDDLQVQGDKGTRELEDAMKARDELTAKCRKMEDELLQIEQAKVDVAELQNGQLMQEEKLKASEQTAKALQIAKEACEKQIEEMKAQQTANGAELDARNQSLTKDFDELRSKASGLETDLALANQLAQSRFKDVTDLKEHLSTVQASLRKSKQEVEDWKTAAAKLEKADASVKKLEAMAKDLKSEIAEYKSQVSIKDEEISTLTDKTKKSEERATALEETFEKSRKDLEQSERTRDEAVDTGDKAQADLKKAQEELKTSKASLDDLEKEVKKFRDEASSLKEQVQLKSAQQTSAQSMMDSMSDQSRELATQMKEVKERNDSLEEELADAHRLLSERGREGETMRRLLAEVEGRAETKVKEMRERMDLAVEERDRAEDEASSIGRRKAREIEDLKTALRDAEREVSRASEARESAEKREREFKSRQEDLVSRATQAQEELAEVRAAMAQLRDALDEGERQSRDLEKQKADLRKTLDDKESRLEKLQKSGKTMAEELRTLQNAMKTQQPGGGSIRSSRSSLESSRVTSPIPRGSNGTPTTGSLSGAASTQQNEYVKNVILQFLEQKEKKYQMALVPVLSRLLLFNAQDEQKLSAAINAR